MAEQPKIDKTVAKAMRLIEALALADSPQGITELASRLDLTKSNVHRLLDTLLRLGYVRRLPSQGRYELNLRLWELGTRVLARLDLKQLAAPYLRRLAERTRETVHLSILDETEVVYIDKIDSDHPIRAYSRVGGRAPAYCVATGKALLVHQPEETIKAIAANATAFTARTITEHAKLLKELGAVRRAGYAINMGEWRDGVRGVAAPVWSSGSQVVAAIGISGPASRLSREKLESFGPLIVELAGDLSKELGYLGAQ